MAILIPSASGLTPLSRALFETPAPAGRRITVGFSYLQRITKPACYEVWFPEEMKRALALKLAASGIADEDFPAEWAAVRQFELLHESGNYKIYDLDPGDLKRATRDLTKSMRAGGYRVTVATIGTYDRRAFGDDLALLDRRLEKRISHLIHMLYLDEASAKAKAEDSRRIEEGRWDFRTALPHVGMVLGAETLFGRQRPSNYRARKFFEIINALPQKHIVHDTAVGLQLPESNAENEWPYVAASDETLASFNLALSHLFDKFNGVSLSKLQGREQARDEVKSSVIHMRSYGHPLSEANLAFYRDAALSLA